VNFLCKLKVLPGKDNSIAECFDIAGAAFFSFSAAAALIQANICDGGKGRGAQHHLTRPTFRRRRKAHLDSFFQSTPRLSMIWLLVSSLLVAQQALAAKDLGTLPIFIIFYFIVVKGFLIIGITFCTNWTLLNWPGKLFNLKCSTLFLPVLEFSRKW